MGVYNSDWLLNQIRGTANVVSKAFKFETLDIDLGQVEDEQGHTIDGNDYIDDLLIHEQYDQATTFIHSQLKRLTTNDLSLIHIFNCLCWNLSLLFSMRLTQVLISMPLKWFQKGLTLCVAKASVL